MGLPRLWRYWPRALKRRWARRHVDVDRIYDAMSMIVFMALATTMVNDPEVRDRLDNAGRLFSESIKEAQDA